MFSEAAFESSFVGLEYSSFTFQLAVDIVTANDATAWISIHSVAVDTALIEFTGVTFSRCPCHLARSLHFVIVPLPIVVTRSSEGHPAISHAFAALPLTFIEGTIRPFVGASTSHLVVVKLTLVDMSFSHFVVSDAVA